MTEFPTDKLIKYAKTNNIPTYVQKANASELAMDSLPTTKAGAWLQSFAKEAASLSFGHRHDAVINNAVELFGIEHDVSTMKQALSSLEKQAQHEPQTASEKYPVRSPEEWDVACSWIEKNAYTIPLSERRELAARLVKTAEEYKRSVNDESLLRYAGLGMCDPLVVHEELQKRAHLLEDVKTGFQAVRQSTSEELKKLAAFVQVSSATISTTEYQNKIAQVLQTVDNEYGFDKHYGRGLHDPDTVTFGLSYKTAEYIRRNACTLVNGNTYDKQDFGKLALNTLTDHFSSDFVHEVTDAIEVSIDKMAEVARTLPRGEADLLSSLLADCGVQPQMKTATHRVSMEEMTKIGKLLQVN